MFKFAVCRMHYVYDQEAECTLAHIARILQLFETEEQAVCAASIFDPYCGYTSNVIPVDELENYSWVNT